MQNAQSRFKMLFRSASRSMYLSALEKYVLYTYNETTLIYCCTIHFGCSTGTANEEFQGPAAPGTSPLLPVIDLAENTVGVDSGLSVDSASQPFNSASRSSNFCRAVVEMPPDFYFLLLIQCSIPLETTTMVEVPLAWLTMHLPSSGTG